VKRGFYRELFRPLASFGRSIDPLPKMEVISSHNSLSSKPYHLPLRLPPWQTTGIIMTIIVHHLDRSRSHRILWLLEELQVPYEIKEYKRDRETMLAPPELKKVHPLGKSPVIENTETKEILAESGAIVEVFPRNYCCEWKLMVIVYY
jgi:Glutathione S-transferase, N-terminal domain